MMATWNHLHMQRPARPVPKLRTKPLAFTSGYRYHAKGVPARDQAVYWALADRCRAGEVYAYSLDRGVWTTWDSEHDWDHTERNGHVRCDCPSTVAGPTDWTRDDLVAGLGLSPTTRPARLTKAQLVARLRAIAGSLPAEALEVLNAA